MTTTLHPQGVGRGSKDAVPRDTPSDQASRTTLTIDGNEAVARIAYRGNEVIAIYPITPASSMGEWADEWAVAGPAQPVGRVPEVIEMQSEGGAAGAVHGALQAGALATTFTASQGLLLMIPNLYKIAGELTPFCLHVAARALATHALSIFGDHSDVMAARQTGLALLASGSVQEAQDLACIAQAATLAARVPFLHFFDGFRTSHEVAKIAALSDDDLRWMIDDELIRAHRARALTPERPVLRGTAQNPDVFFQAREACNRFYDACAGIVQATMDRFADPHRACATAVRLRRAPRCRAGNRADGVRRRDRARDRRAAGGARRAGRRAEGAAVPAVRRRAHCCAALPASVHAIAVLDRTKEPGADGEPLYKDVVTALAQAAADGARAMPRVIGGRYGLASKEFTPGMVKAVFDELAQAAPKRAFTVGIHDDLTHLSLAWDTDFRTDASRQLAARRVLGSRRRRHGVGQQELDQDPRRDHRPAWRRATSSTTRRSPVR